MDNLNKMMLRAKLAEFLAKQEFVIDIEEQYGILIEVALDLKNANDEYIQNLSKTIEKNKECSKFEHDQEFIK